MSTIIGGSSPSVTFPDSTVQNTAGLPLTGGTLSGALTVPTLNSPSGVFATQNGMNGIAKAWVNFDPSSGSSASIRSSFNVSSVTYNATGDYTINFTTAMPNANYAALTTSRRTNGSDAQGIATVYPKATYSNAISTTFVRVVTGYTSDGSLVNYDYVGALIISS